LRLRQEGGKGKSQISPLSLALALFPTESDENVSIINLALSLVFDDGNSEYIAVKCLQRCLIAFSAT